MSILLLDHDTDQLIPYEQKTKTISTISVIALVGMILIDVIWTVVIDIYESESTRIIFDRTIYYDAQLKFWCVDIPFFVLIFLVLGWIAQTKKNATKNKTSTCLSTSQHLESPIFVIISIICTISLATIILTHIFILTAHSDPWHACYAIYYYIPNDSVSTTSSYPRVIFRLYVWIELAKDVVQFLFTIVFAITIVKRFRFRKLVCDTLVHGKDITLPTDFLCKESDTMAACVDPHIKL